jgi:hypothetical protein
MGEGGKGMEGISNERKGLGDEAKRKVRKKKKEKEMGYKKLLRFIVK